MEESCDIPHCPCTEYVIESQPVRDIRLRLAEITQERDDLKNRNFNQQLSVVAAREDVVGARVKAERLGNCLEKVLAATISHVDGRDLLAELHPRHTLDITKRVDAVETLYEGDWLSNLYEAIKEARELLSHPCGFCDGAGWFATAPNPEAEPVQTQCEPCGGTGKVSGA